MSAAPEFAGFMSLDDAPAGTVAALRINWPKDYGPVEAPRTIVAGLLERGTLAAIYGPSNVGKSTAGLDIGLTVARKVAWRGMRTSGGLVVYIGLESAAGLRRRVIAYQKHHGIGPVAHFCDIGESVRLLDVADIERVLAAVRAAEREAGTECVLIVLDTLARAIAGGDENDGRDMGALVGACDRLRHETGATVLIVHHSGKDSAKGARGHSSLRAALDTEIEVSGDANPRQMIVRKQRDLPNGAAWAFDLEPVQIGTDAETGEPITACVVVHRDDIASTATEPKGRAVTAILRALRAQQADSKDGPCTWTLEGMRATGRHLGLHRNSARDAVDRLVMSGLLIPTVGGYRLAEADR